MKKIFYVFIGVALLAGVAGGAGIAGDYYFVNRVVDGDTVVLSNGEKVRLIGIDTPEVYESGKLHSDAERTGKDIKTIQALGKKASEYTKKRLDGKQVRIEFDQNNEYIRHKDKYGRLLAYIYLPDGTFFNAEIIRDGYANAYTKFPFKYMDEFRKLEKEARENKRGLWADESPALSIGEGVFVGSSRSKVFHKPSCKWAGMIDEKNKIKFKNREEAVNEGYRPCQVCRP